MVPENEISVKAARGGIAGLARRPLVHVALILIVGFCAYSNTFDVPFQWDDLMFIRDNHTLKDLSYFTDTSKAKSDALMFYRSNVRRYVGYLSFALNYNVHGLDVKGYHAVNIAIHLMNALLVYLLTILTFRTPSLKNSGLRERSGMIALFSALLFVAHPIQTEAVTYIFQRLASLTALFYLLSLTSYIMSRLSETQKGKYGFYLLSLASAVLAMKTKENAFTLPFVIVLYEYLFLSGPRVKRALWLMPMVLTTAVIPLVLLSAGTAGEDAAAGAGGFIEAATRMHFTGSRWHYLYTQFTVLVTYLRLLVLPVGQNLVYDYPLYGTLMEPRVFASFLFLASFFAFALYLIWRSRKAGQEHLRLCGFGILWFFITISVESSIIPIVMLIDEYRVYLPSAGLFAGAASGAFALYGRINNGRLRKAALTSFCLMIVVLSAATYTRNSVWKSRVSLWQDVVSKSPDRASARTNLGIAYKEAGLPEMAVREYQEAIRLSPYDSLAHNNLGNAYYETGLTELAIQEYLDVLKINGDFMAAHMNLCKAYKDKGLIDRALEYCAHAVRSGPNDPDAHYNLAVAYGIKGMTDKEIDEYLIAIRLDPGHPEARTNLGAAFASKGLYGKAVESYLRALSLDPDDEFTENNLAIAYYLQGSLDKAIEHYTRALLISPSYAVAYNNLAVAYEEKGVPKRARESFLNAIEIDPGFAEARVGLAKIYINEGARGKARAELNAALKSSPGHKEAKRLLNEMDKK